MSDEGQSGGGEKTFDPTPKKREDARAKGDIVKSSDVSVSASYFGLFLAILIWGLTMTDKLVSTLAGILARVDTLADGFGAADARSWLTPMISDMTFALVPLFALPFGLTLLSLFAQNAVVFAPEKLMPKLSRISPMAIAKNRFGPTGLFEFGKSLTKLIVVSLVVGAFILANINQFLGLTFASGPVIATEMVTSLTSLLGLVFLIALVIACFDYFWQVYDHKRKLMMTRQEVTDEQKHSEGDPHMKAQRRQRGYDIATQRMLADVPTASVVIVNPQHFAVALQWDEGAAGAPVCVAKGMDEIAARIRETAMLSGVPIRSDPPTARAIFASVDVGQEVPPNLYRAVAAAIRYAEKIRKLAKMRG